MSNQIFTDGDVKNIDGQEFECTAVTYQEDAEGERSQFGYTFRLKAELDAEREAEREAQEAREEDARLAEEQLAAWHTPIQSRENNNREEQ